MPDAPSDTEQIHEGMETGEEMSADDAFSAAFNLEDEGQPAGEPEPLEDGQEEDEEQPEAEPSKDGGPQRAKGNPGEEGEEPSELDKLLARAKERGFKDEDEPDQKPETEGQKPKDEPKGEPDKPQDQPPAPQPQRPSADGPLPITKELAKAYLGAIPDDALPEAMTIGDDEVNLRAWARDDPEAYASAKVIAGSMANEVLRSAVQSGQLLTAQHGNFLFQTIKKLQATVDNLEQSHGDMAFWDAVGVKKHTVANDKGFMEWLDAKPKSVRELVEKTNDPSDVRAVWDLYSADKAKRGVDEIDAKDRKARQAEDDVLGSSIRKKGKAPKGTVRSPEDEFRAGFNEE